MPREKVGEEKHARRGTMYMEAQALYSLEEQVKKTLYNLIQCTAGQKDIVQPQAGQKEVKPVPVRVPPHLTDKFAASLFGNLSF